MSALLRRRVMGTGLTVSVALMTIAAAPVVGTIIVLVLAGGPA